MTHPPAAGEQAALRGFRWQYDQIAALVYDALLDGDFVALRLADPNAGRVDDLVLIRRGGVHGYQFKSVKFNRLTSFKQVVRRQTTRSGGQAPSLIQSLADGWQRLRSQEDNAQVHFVTNQFASTNDHLSSPNDISRASPDHFSAFLIQVLEPLRLGAITLEDVATGWRPALAKLREATGLGLDEFASFLKSIHFHFAAGPGLPTSSSTRHQDIRELSDALFRRVSQSSTMIALDRRRLLELIGWADRPVLRSRHEFPVDFDTYAPLTDAIDELNGLVACYSSGYVAVVGPPGAGKSTLLSQALTGSSDRIVRYYAFVPWIAPARSRLTGGAFLHDVVLLLSKNGLTTGERQLPARNIDGLRQQLAEQFDMATREFARSGRRTVVVVDGLDHVDRDYAGHDGLLGELPRLSELPDGVLFVVGSRTLGPLRADARQQIDERRATVSLEHHRLSRASVLEICRRAPITAGLTPEVHDRVAQLCNGHPLALSYLLNRLQDADGKSPVQLLATAPAYEGDIAAEYRAVWDQVEADDDIFEILAICSRWRTGFTTEWLSTWAPDSAVRHFWREFRFLFRVHGDGYRFFHDSFRQFAADRTALSDDGDPDPAEDAKVHRRVADLCAGTSDPMISAEQLYHRHRAGQDLEALGLAQQLTFREQYRRLRSPDLIREDVAIALHIAAKRADVPAMARLLLALIEVTERTAALEDLDMPGLLYDAGLVDQAVSYCGAENQRVPLAQAYDFAARLGRDGDQRGRRIFDLVEHDGFDDPKGIAGADHEGVTAAAWVRAAVLFRPLSIVIAAVQRVVEEHVEGDEGGRHSQTERRRRYRQMMKALIHAVALDADASSLDAVDSALANHTEQLLGANSQLQRESDEQITDDDLDRHFATIVALRLHAQTEALDSATTAEDAETRLSQLLSTLRGVPLFHDTMLEAAELFASHGMSDPAAKFLDQLPYGKALTASQLSDLGKPDPLDQQFRYWRLRFLLASSEADVPASIPPDPSTPAGNNISADAPIHRDRSYIGLAAGIDEAIQTLGRIDAASASEQPTTPGEVWAALASLLDLFPPSAKRVGGTFHRIAELRRQLFPIAVGVASRCGHRQSQRLCHELAGRFEVQPDQWPLILRLELADEFQSAGVSVPWYRQTLSAYEEEALAEDVHSRLGALADLVRRYARDGDGESACRLVNSLVPVAFGIGYRKDYQCDTWVAWLGRVLSEPGGERFVEDAAWLARLLTAVEPQTEGAPGAAAADLPAAIVHASPKAALRVFEYLVRHGTVRHLDALAALVRALVESAGADGLATAELAGDIACRLIAPAADEAFPELAASVIQLAEHAAGREEAKLLAKTLGGLTDSHALPTARQGWRQGLGLVAEDEKHGTTDSSGDEYGALVFSDGRRIRQVDVGSHVRTVDDVIILRRDEAESSEFRWDQIVDKLQLTNDEVRRLSEVFCDGSQKHAEVLASLAETAMSNGDRCGALHLASTAFQTASGESWSPYFGGARLRAAEVIIRLGDDDARVAACRDFVAQATSNRWFPGLLRSDFESIILGLAPDLDPSSIWSEIRVYLEGIAEGLDLGDPEVLVDHGCRWWLIEPTGDRRIDGHDSTPAPTLAELVVGHLSHPTWLVRDAAIAIVGRSLKNGNDDVAGALARFAQTDSSDDTLERVGLCLAAGRARSGFVVPVALKQIQRILAGYPSQVLRDLAGCESPILRKPLPGKYQLAVLGVGPGRRGSDSLYLAPFERQYAMLADVLGLDLDTLLGVAARYASEALKRLPRHESIMSALVTSGVKHAYAHQELAASRAAFGRVLADLADAGEVNAVPQELQRFLRTLDVELLGRTPSGRPDLIPNPPAAGHDQTAARWLGAIESRIEEHVARSSNRDRLLIAAKSRLTVLNWGHLEEELVCGTAAGNARPEDDRFSIPHYALAFSDLAEPWPSEQLWNGAPLVVENIGHGFHQLHAGWLAFRPDLAARLQWTPDSSRRGSWHTATGHLAVETIWWVDGWWGRQSRAFDDTEAVGYAVMLSARGLDQVSETIGEITRHFVLTRCGKDDGAEVGPVSTTRSLPVGSLAT